MFHSYEDSSYKETRVLIKITRAYWYSQANKPIVHQYSYHHLAKHRNTAPHHHHHHPPQGFGKSKRQKERKKNLSKLHPSPLRHPQNTPHLFRPQPHIHRPRQPPKRLIISHSRQILQNLMSPKLLLCKAQIPIPLRKFFQLLFTELRQDSTCFSVPRYRNETIFFVKVLIILDLPFGAMIGRRARDGFFAEEYEAAVTFDVESYCIVGGGRG